MNEIQIFKNSQFGEVRLVEIDGTPYFVANDVANALGYSVPKDAIRDHVTNNPACDGAAFQRPIPDALGRQQDTVIITEPAVYALIMSSKQERAVEFQKWVFNEVLPSIRQRGIYTTPATIDHIINDPEFGIKLLTTLKEERAKRLAAEQQAQLETHRADDNACEALAERALANGLSRHLQARANFNLEWGNIETLVKGIYFYTRTPIATIYDKGYAHVKQEMKLATKPTKAYFRDGHARYIVILAAFLNDWLSKVRKKNSK
jgi:prophage antirepressor-like protein